MSFIHRVAHRALAGTTAFSDGTTMPTPKPGGLNAAPAVHRSATDEAPEAARVPAIHRAAMPDQPAEEPAEDMANDQVQRQADDQADDDQGGIEAMTEQSDTAAPLREPEVESDPAAQRQADEMADESGEQDTMQREMGSEEPEAQRQSEQAEETMQRQSEEMPVDDQQQDVQPMRPHSIARQSEPDTGSNQDLTAEDMHPNNATPPDVMAGEPEPQDVRAIRRQASPQSAAVSTVGQNMHPAAVLNAVKPGAQSANDTAGQTVEQAATPVFPEAFPDSHPPGHDMHPLNTESQQPRVVIDQLDVLIHEPVAAASRGGSGQSMDQTLRARYLRRL